MQEIYSLVRRVWIDEEKRQVVRITGSHKHSCLFGGAISLDGKQLFRQDQKFNVDTFLDFIEIIHSRFPKCYLFIDKASPHYKSNKIKEYFDNHKDTLIPVYLPTTASPGFMIMEEVWNIAKRDLLVLNTFHHLQILRKRYLVILEQKDSILI